MQRKKTVMKPITQDKEGHQRPAQQDAQTLLENIIALDQALSTPPITSKELKIVKRDILGKKILKETQESQISRLEALLTKSKAQNKSDMSAYLQDFKARAVDLHKPLTKTKVTEVKKPNEAVKQDILSVLTILNSYAQAGGASDMAMYDNYFNQNIALLKQLEPPYPAYLNQIILKLIKIAIDDKTFKSNDRVDNLIRLLKNPIQNLSAEVHQAVRQFRPVVGRQLLNQRYPATANYFKTEPGSFTSIARLDATHLYGDEVICLTAKDQAFMTATFEKNSKWTDAMYLTRQALGKPRSYSAHCEDKKNDNYAEPLNFICALRLLANSCGNDDIESCLQKIINDMMFDMPSLAPLNAQLKLDIEQDMVKVQWQTNRTLNLSELQKFDAYFSRFNIDIEAVTTEYPVKLTVNIPIKEFTQDFLIWYYSTLQQEQHRVRLALVTLLTRDTLNIVTAYLSDPHFCRNMFSISTQPAQSYYLQFPLEQFTNRESALRIHNTALVKAIEMGQHPQYWRDHIIHLYKAAGIPVTDELINEELISRHRLFKYAFALQMSVLADDNLTDLSDVVTGMQLVLQKQELQEEYTLQLHHHQVQWLEMADGVVNIAPPKEETETFADEGDDALSETAEETGDWDVEKQEDDTEIDALFEAEASSADKVAGKSERRLSFFKEKQDEEDETVTVTSKPKTPDSPSM